MPSESEIVTQGDSSIARAKPWRYPRLSLGPGLIGAMVLVVIVLPCVTTLPWSVARYEAMSEAGRFASPTLAEPMGTDLLGRSLIWRSLLGGAISLGIGAAAASLAVGIGVAWGAISGYAGGRVDAAMMRIVDVLYGLPYILLVVLVKIALQPAMTVALTALLGGSESGDDQTTTARAAANVLTLLVAIGGVSWLTMARVIRGQVLSLRSQPFIEAAHALGLSPTRILLRHILPNLVGPIIVYATLTVPTAILQESFLSFLGIGVQAPMPSWGSLASDGLRELHRMTDMHASLRWWLLVWPCVLLGLTLLALNFLGDALRRKLDPRQARA